LRRNITEALASRIELRHSKEAAEVRAKKANFLATMSHELTRLTDAGTGLSHVLNLEIFGALNVKQKDISPAFLAVVNTLLELISDILDLSKI